MKKLIQMWEEIWGEDSLKKEFQFQIIIDILVEIKKKR